MHHLFSKSKYFYVPTEFNCVLSTTFRTTSTVDSSVVWSVTKSGNFCKIKTQFYILRDACWGSYGCVLEDAPSCEAYSFSTGSTCGLYEKSIHSHIDSFIRTAKLPVYRDYSRRGGCGISETESFIKLWFMYLYFLFLRYNYELTTTGTNVVQFSVNKMAEAWS